MILNILQGEQLRVSKEKLVIEREEDIKEIALKDIKVLLLENTNTSITMATLLKLSDYGIQTIICNQKKQPTLQLLNLYDNYKVTERIGEQISWKRRDKNICFLEIIRVKLTHQKELLEYFNKEKEADYLKELIGKLNRRLTSEKIRAIEGLGARIYFKGLFGDSFKRFDDDIENMGLNYGYTLLRTLISKIVVAKGLHPSLGIEHKSILNNFNLSDDIIEIFRPMVDYIVTLYISSYIEFDWECKSKLLEIFYQRVRYKDKYLPIEQGVEKYIDEIILFMSGKKKSLDFPKLEIEKYEY